MCEYYHIVPWYNSEEWHRVYETLYAPTPSLENKQKALQWLLIWKARCPSLPSGIESTLTLLEVQIQDEKNSEDAIHQQLLRLAYSSAIMRFVNHMLDMETAKGTSFYQAAKTLGVPDWIIDMRHDSAHSNNLPSIELLREATQISLEWLHQNYWDKHKLCIQDYLAGQNEPNSSEENKVAALMSLCTSLSICCHSKCNIKNLSDIPDAEMVGSIINDVRDLFYDNIDLSNLKTVSITALLNAIDLQSKKLLKPNGIVNVNKALLGEDSIILSLDLIDYLGKNEFYDKKQLHPHYVQCFEVLLTFLHTNNLLLDFIVGLTKESQRDDDSNRCLLAALWVSEILKAVQKSNQFIDQMKKVDPEGLVNRKKTDLKHLFYHWFPKQKNSALILNLLKPAPKELSDIMFVQSIISAYNPYLQYFMKDIVSLLDPKLPNAVPNKIFELVNMISSPSQIAQSRKVYTVEDLKELTSSNPVSLDTANSDSDCEMIPERDKPERSRFTSKLWLDGLSKFNWSLCPIGTLPWVNGNMTNKSKD